MLQWICRKINIITKAAIITGVVLLAVFCFKNNFALAQTAGEVAQEGLQTIQQPLGLPATDIRLIVANIIRAALGLVGIVLLVIILYAGYLWMTAGGNEDQIEKAKKILTNAVIGLAIILSAYSIVWFVMRMLGIGNAGAPTGSDVNIPAQENYFNSGALGGVIKDHYPMRNQTDVPRNTRIVITFRKPIVPESFIDDTTNDGIFGNCKTPLNNWNTDCDHLKPLNDNFINIKNSSTSVSVAGAAALVSSSTIDGISGVYTLMLKPITNTNSADGGNLGSEQEKIPYLVHLGNGIKFTDDRLSTNNYEWTFTCDTKIDTTPPHVINVFPKAGDTEVKNSVIQVIFSKPMDPIGLQGDFSPNSSAGALGLSGNSVYLKINHSDSITGSFNLTNGYTILEFAPSTECGRNACGNKIYCLPVCKGQGATCVEDNYTLLLKTAVLLNQTSFAAIPQSGVMDLSGNALDGDNNGAPTTTPRENPVFPSQKTPDNYYWSFNIKDIIDATAPFLRKVVPGPGAQNIPANQEWSMTFSKRMRAESLYNIGLDEKPAHPDNPLWRVPRVTYDDVNDYSYVNMLHGPFLDAAQQDYFPIIASDVEDVHFNCFYPGQGPTNSNTCSGDPADTNCCAIKIDETNKDFCCNGAVNPAYANKTQCLKFLKGE